jgi:hypothetical protein
MLYVPNPKWPQFPHQRKDLESMWDKPGWAWWWEQGTGKSKELIDNAGMLFCNAAVGALLYVGPNGLHRNFITQQLAQHLPPELLEKARTIFWHTQKADTKRWQESAREVVQHRDGLSVLAMSYDGMATPLGMKLAKEFLEARACLYGADETQRMKDPESFRTKVMLKSAPYARFRRVMTGTPVSKAPWDAWSQIKFADPDYWKPYGLDSIEGMKSAFGEWDKASRRVPLGMLKRENSLQAFYNKQGTPEELRTHYLQPKRRDGGVVHGIALQQFPVIAKDEEDRPRYKNLDRLREIIGRIRSRVLKKDVFPDLPDKITTPLEFELSPAQRRAYASLVDLGFVMTEDGRACTATMALTLLLRLHQIACGYLQTDLDPSRGDEEPHVEMLSPNPRMELLEELTADMDHQALIWARFTPDINAICAMLKKQGKTFARYDGQVSDDEAAYNEEQFHKGNAQFFVSNPQKGGEGLTLVEARTAIYYSYSFKLIEYLQSSDRPHRYGQKNAVNEIFFRALGTVDDKIIATLTNNMDMASQVTGDTLRQWLAPAQGELFIAPRKATVSIIDEPTAPAVVTNTADPFGAAMAGYVGAIGLSGK